MPDSAAEDEPPLPPPSRCPVDLRERVRDATGAPPDPPECEIGSLAEQVVDLSSSELTGVGARNEDGEGVRLRVYTDEEGEDRIEIRDLEMGDVGKQVRLGLVKIKLQLMKKQ